MNCLDGLDRVSYAHGPGDGAAALLGAWLLLWWSWRAVGRMLGRGPGSSWWRGGGR